MPYRIRITDDAVYHNGEFIKQNPPQLPEYAELYDIIQSNTSPEMDKEPKLLTQDTLEFWGMKLFLSVFGSERPIPNEPVLLDIINPLTRMIPFEILHDGNTFLSQTIGVTRVFSTGRSYEWKPLSKFLYIFDRKLNDISQEEEFILFALSLFDDPAPPDAVHFICKQEIPSSFEISSAISDGLIVQNSMVYIRAAF